MYRKILYYGLKFYFVLRPEFNIYVKIVDFKSRQKVFKLHLERVRPDN